MSSGGALVRKVSVDGGRKRARASTRVSMRLVPRSLRLKGIPNGVHEFVRSNWVQLNVSNAGVQIPAGGTFAPEFAMRFNLASVTYIGIGTATVAMPGIAELNSMFDMIQLSKVEISFRNRCAGNDAATIGLSTLRIGTALDYTDDTPQALTELQQFNTFKDKQLNADGSEHKVVLRPKFLKQVTYSGAGAFGLQPGTGYVSSTADVAHYGVKGVIDGGITSSIWISVKYYYNCKNTK